MKYRSERTGQFRKPPGASWLPGIRIPPSLLVLPRRQNIRFPYQNSPLYFSVPFAKNPRSTCRVGL